MSTAALEWFVTLTLAPAKKELSALERGTEPFARVTYIMKNKIRSSYEIEDFVEAQLCKLCVLL